MSDAPGADADEQLMLAYARGEASAFDALYARHRTGVYRYLLHNCNNAGTADELFQDVWMNVIRSVASRSRIRHYAKLGRLFATDREFDAFAARDCEAPEFFRGAVKREIGPFYEHLSPEIRAYLEQGRAG